MLNRTFVTLSLAAVLMGCGGGSSSNNSSNNNGGVGVGGTTDNGGMNGTYTGLFNATSPSAASFTVTAQFTQAAAAGSPITGTATISGVSGTLPSCLGTPGTSLNVAGAEASGGGLTMALINGPDGNSPKFFLPSKGAPDTAFPDVSGSMDMKFSGPFSVENCPALNDPTAMSGTGTLTRQ